MTRVKVCGITNPEDALKAVRFGAWALGFIFYKKSPRYVSPFKVRKILAALPPFVTPVGVFVDAKEGAAKDILKFTGIRTVQFHGEESPEYCRRFSSFTVIKAFRVAEDFSVSKIVDFPAQAFLFDTFQKDSHGGTGTTFSWDLIKEAKNYNRPVILSGGLNADNVASALEAVRPYAVDVSSGVEEAPGKKSERLLADFFSRISPAVTL